MQNIILSPVAISDLVDMIANELESRMPIHSKTEVPPIEKQRLYGDKAAADHIGCTHLTISKLRKDGKVRYYTLGRRYYYYAHELDEDLRGGTHRFGELRGKRGKK